MPELTLQKLGEFFKNEGVRTLLIKSLAAEDNPKNQIYWGPTPNVLALFEPRKIIDTVAAGRHSQKKISSPRSSFHASLDWLWMSSEGDFFGAPHAKLIFYPQYPEIRLSALLRGCPQPYGRTLSELLNRSSQGRVLVLGSDRTGRVLAHLADENSKLAKEVSDLGDPDYNLVFHTISLDIESSDGSWSNLRALLSRICSEGWHTGRKRNTVGVVPYNARNGAGYTLEALLGIEANGDSRPDYRGWEIKAKGGGAITLMTPEPDGGFYRDEGAEAFVRRWGYSDRNGISDRLNFGGVYRIGSGPHHLTQLTLVDRPDENRIAFLDSRDEIAASWSHRKLFAHWTRKHAQATYVPYEARSLPRGIREYRFHPDVSRCIGTSFERFYSALLDGRIYLDPGIKLEDVNSSNPRLKKRSQFRVSQKHIGSLYDEFSVENVCDG